MSTDYIAVCVTCKCRMDKPFASGSGFYGFKVWDGDDFAKWLGHGMAVGTHEGHDVRIMSADRFYDLEGDEEWERTE